MPHTTTPVNGSNQAPASQGPSRVSAPAPGGIASGGSSIQSSDQGSSKGVFRRIYDSLFNILKGIKNAIVNIFYRLFFCKAPPSDIERKYLDFQSRLERVDSLSEELALKEADEHPVAYTLFGRAIFKKSWNLPWKIMCYLPWVGNKTYYEIGRRETQKDFRPLLIHLKQYYKTQVERLANQIRRDSNS